MTNFMSKGLIAIAGATVLGLASLGIATEAHAAPNENTDTNKYCWTKLGNGDQVGHPPGSTITVVNGSSGGKVTYKCNGKTGEWEKVPLVAGGFSRATYDVQSVSLVSTMTSTTPDFSSNLAGSFAR